MAAAPNTFRMNMMETFLEKRPQDRTLNLRVRAIRHETPDIASFELVDPEGRELPPFTAGAHIDVRIADRIQRQYSLCNDPSERHRYEIAVLKEPNGRGGSVGMHAISE